MRTIPYSLFPFLFTLFAFLLTGCQSPSTRYTNGLILWCGSTAVGIGWGEYTEVAAGGKLKRTLTGKEGEKGTLEIDNSLTPSTAADMAADK
jgi:hypothetical protein